MVEIAPDLFVNPDHVLALMDWGSAATPRTKILFADGHHVIASKSIQVVALRLRVGSRE